MYPRLISTCHRRNFQKEGFFFLRIVILLCGQALVRRMEARSRFLRKCILIILPALISDGGFFSLSQNDARSCLCNSRTTVFGILKTKDQDFRGTRFVRAKHGESSPKNDFFRCSSRRQTRRGKFSFLGQKPLAQKTPRDKIRLRLGRNACPVPS